MKSEANQGFDITVEVIAATLKEAHAAALVIVKQQHFKKIAEETSPIQAGHQAELACIQNRHNAEVRGLREQIGQLQNNLEIRDSGIINALKERRRAQTQPSRARSRTPRRAGAEVAHMEQVTDKLQTIASLLRKLTVSSDGLELIPRCEGHGLPPLYQAPSFHGLPAVEVNHLFHFKMTPLMILGPNCNHHL